MIEFKSDPDVELINFMGGDDQTAMSAWVSFGNDREERLNDRGRVEGLINFLYKNDHLTPFESSVFTFRVSTPIFVTREIQRHRAASYNEWSGRYAEMQPVFYLPAENRPLVQAGKAGNYHFVAGSEEQFDLIDANYNIAYQTAWSAYQDMLDAGIAKEVARNVLPVGVYTQFYVTMNARNLMHFLTLRTAPNALHEIRQVAGGMEEHLAEKMPLTYKAYKENR